MWRKCYRPVLKRCLVRAFSVSTDWAIFCFYHSVPVNVIVSQLFALSFLQNISSTWLSNYLAMQSCVVGDSGSIVKQTTKEQPHRRCLSMLEIFERLYLRNSTWPVADYVITPNLNSSVFCVITRCEVVRNWRFGTIGSLFKSQGVQEDTLILEVSTDR